MQERIFQGESDNNRLDMLEANAVKVVNNYPYFYQLTEGELRDTKFEVSDLVIQFNALEHEKKQVAQDYKNKIDPIKIALNAKAEVVKQKGIHMTGTLYRMEDIERGEYGLYDSQGRLVESGRISPGTTLSLLSSTSLTGTND